MLVANKLGVEEKNILKLISIEKRKKSGNCLNRNV